MVCLGIEGRAFHRSCMPYRQCVTLCRSDLQFASLMCVCWGGGGKLHTHDEPKVNVEKAPICSEHEIVQMAISNPEDVRHNTVARTTPHECVHHLSLQAKRPCNISIPSLEAHCLVNLRHSCLHPK